MEIYEWQAIAPLNNFWIKPEKMPFCFDENVSIQEIPKWVKIFDENDPLREEAIQKFDDNNYCILVNYRASGIGNELELANMNIYYSMLALWLVKEIPFFFNSVGHFNVTNQVTRRLEERARFWPTSDDRLDEFKKQDFKDAKKVFFNIKRIKSDNNLFTALSIILKIAVQDDWLWRYMGNWMLLEALFGDKNITKYQMVSRIEKFLEFQGEDKFFIKDEIIADYEWRCTVVHGRSLSSLNNELSIKLVERIERLSRKIILKIFLDHGLFKIFSNYKCRINYLKNLISFEKD